MTRPRTRRKAKWMILTLKVRSKLRLLLLALALLVTNDFCVYASPPPVPGLTADIALKKAQDSVFKVTLREISTHAEVRVGSGFLVEPHLLITNYQQISDAFLRPESFDIIVADHITAYVVAVDARSDLAAIYVSDVIGSPLASTSHLEALPGEPIYLLGFQNSVESQLHQAVFQKNENSEITIVSAKNLIALSEKIGGPAVNRQGQLVASIRAYNPKSDGTLQLSALPSIQRLIQNASTHLTGNNLPSTHPGFQTVAQQIHSSEHDFLESFTKDIKTQKIGNLQFDLSEKQFDCGYETFGESSQHIFTCKTKSIGHISYQKRGMGQHIFLEDNSLKTFLWPEVFERVDQIRNQGSTFIFPKLQRLFPDVIKYVMKRPFLATYLVKKPENCLVKNTTNRNGLDMIVRICTHIENSFEPLATTYVKVDILNQKNPTHVSQVLEGISLPTTSRLITLFLNSIRITDASTGGQK